MLSTKKYRTSKSEEKKEKKKSPKKSVHKRKTAWAYKK